MTTTTNTTTTSTTRDHAGLRAVLRLDAVASGGLGVVSLAAGALGGATLIGLPAAVLVGVGVFLVAYAGGLVALAGRRTMWRPGAWIVVGGNAAWVLASLALAVGARAELTVLGAVVVLAQAVAVAVLAELQYRGLRRP